MLIEAHQKVTHLSFRCVYTLHRHLEKAEEEIDGKAPELATHRSARENLVLIVGEMHAIACIS